ncbi:hypothetical protein [Limnohabitans sp. T6-5]|uniref:hypothetical protein n=1 Tax=Limnohabitans sp. T6-5 TaxID=1100724 RepID=UPI001E2D580D|nr:hypothetical protein [Limnohabitans sp. T6-5]
MSTELTPAQRLAVSRARLADALRDPAWLILLQRWLQAKARESSTRTPSGPGTES